MVYVLTSDKCLAYPTVVDARAQHGRLFLAFTSQGDPVIDDGEYYPPIPETCPYNGLKCRGGGCGPCEYVPPTC
jgi:hypothetical protein